MESSLIPVTCAFIEKEGRFLLARRSAEMSLPLKWELPGGKIEPGESAESCIVREIAEELGIFIAVAQALPHSDYTGGQKHIRLIPFRCLWLSGDLQAHEHDELRWVNAAEALAMDLAAADVEVIRQYAGLGKGSI